MSPNPQKIAATGALVRVRSSADPQRRLIQFQRRDLRHNLRCSLEDGAGFSFMVGLGETYLPAFVLALGMGEVNSGLIAAVPMIAGAFLQLISPYMVQALGSYRKWVVLCASLQCFLFIPFIVAAAVGYLPPALAFLLAALYWGVGMGAGPAWNGWMGRNIAIPVRTHFFAKRTRVLQFGTLIGFVAGGALLHWLPTQDKTMGFAVLFAGAFLGRWYSVRQLAKQTEDPDSLKDFKPPSPSTLIRPFLQNKTTARLFIYVFAMQFAVYLSSPFFTPFMLEQLKVGYLGYVILISASYISKVLFLPAMAAFAKRHSTKRLMWLAGLGILWLPLAWLVSSNLIYLTCMQFVSGFFWCAFDLGFPLLVLETVAEKDRMNVLVVHNFCQSIVIVLGSLVGAAFLDGLGRSAVAYGVVFSISAVARVATLPLLARFSPPKQQPAFEWRMMTIRPSLGQFFVPVLESIRPRRPKGRKGKKAA